MNLNDRALLAQFSASQWMGRKLDKRASKEVTDTAGAVRNSARVNKDLLPGCTELEAIHSKTGYIRTLFYDNTLPWGLDGMQILPATNYLEFMTTFRKEKADWEFLCREFFGIYEHAVWTAEHDRQRSLGKLYVPTDYPKLDDIKGKFKLDLAIFPVPATDFRVQLATDELTRLQEDVVRRVQDAQKTAMLDVWQRLFDRVKKIAEKCADPKAIFRDTMMENATELLAMLPRLNFTDDPNLEAMRLEVEAKLIHHPEALRNNPDLRRDTAAEAKRIMDAMGGYMGVLGQ